MVTYLLQSRRAIITAIRTTHITTPNAIYAPCKPFTENIILFKFSSLLVL